jgi:O-antigen ligase
MMVFLAILVGRKSPRIILAGAVALLLAMPLVPASYWQRMSSITNDSMDATGSRQARRVLLGEAWRAFTENPLTGVGAGNFVAFDPQGRTESWKEAHNVLLQVASELGIAGVAVFLFLIFRAMFAARQASRLLLRAIGVSRRRGTPDHARPQVITVREAAYLDAHGAAMTAAVAGWFFSALFASVAYNWTFYYLLALAIAPREILLDRLSGRSVPNSPVVRRSKVASAPIALEART